MALVKASEQSPHIGTEPDSRDLGSLLVDLVAAEPSVRRSAARRLVVYPEAAMAVCDRLEGEGSPSVRAMLFTALIHQKSPAVAGRLVSFLRSEDVPLRNAAIEALQDMSDAVVPHIQGLLSDGDSDVRIFAVNILGALRHTQAPEWLAGVVRTDPHVNVCAAAVDALAEIGGLDVLVDLEALRHRFQGDVFMKFAIDAAMGRIRGQ
ncbi:MAG: HEAT repeat domain-containing protein [Rhodospirillum sp.]|nr:HEAT repeat domain-containing protein [Rhodospirillum sp.]MCF8502544.1 HEAT repeat domain-containing protein [Rhodospirillum sp.]